MRQVKQLIATLFVVGVTLLPVRATHAQEKVNFPDLTGPYQVGRITYHFMDDTRAEVYSDDPDDVREVMITVYYPAEPETGAVPAPYVDISLRDAIEEVMGLPGGFLDNIQSHAYEQAPIVQERFPVVIFSPGAGVNSIFYTALFEDISSHGYVVVGITHPYEAMVAVFPDERRVTSNDIGVNFYADMWDLSEEQKQTLLGVPGSQRLPSLQAALSEDQMNAGLDQYYAFVVPYQTQDVLFVLNELIDLNENDPILAGYLDFERMGIFGHSLGGATAANVLYEDSRFKAGIDIDGSLFSAKDYTLSSPFMLLVSDNSLTIAQDSSEATLTMIQEYCDEISAFYERLAPGYIFTLSGVTHNGLISDFTLVESVYPQVLGGLTKDIDPVRAVQLVSTYVWTFFDQFLKGESVSQLDRLSADFPEVQAGPEACMP